MLGGLVAQLGWVYREAQTIFRGGQIGVLAKGFGTDILMQLRGCLDGPGGPLMMQKKHL